MIQSEVLVSKTFLTHIYNFLEERMHKLTVTEPLEAINAQSIDWMGETTTDQKVTSLKLKLIQSAD